MSVSHYESCKECKERVYELLTALYGKVERNYNINLPLTEKEMEKSHHYTNLKEIYSSLQAHRGHTEFVRAKKLPNVDYYIKENNFIVEFDESQHFTPLRKLALKNYPEELKIGFKKEKWINLCELINAKDNDPVYRDEQRAWYDTLRDFAPSILNLNPTIRLYSKDHIWCELDVNKEVDLNKFKEILSNRYPNYKSNINEFSVYKIKNDGMSMAANEKNFHNPKIQKHNNMNRYALENMKEGDISYFIFKLKKIDGKIKVNDFYEIQEYNYKNVNNPKIRRHNNLNRYAWDDMDEGEINSFIFIVEKINGEIIVINFEKLNDDINKKPELQFKKSNNSLNKNLTNKNLDFLEKLKNKTKKSQKLVKNNSLNKNNKVNITKKPNCIKTFLLADKSKEKLFKTNNGAFIQLYPDKSGKLLFYGLFNNFSSAPIDMSLEEIGSIYLKLDDPSVQNVLKYFVTPEMEIERIFNNLRYKYLQSIYLSGLENPKEYFNADYNKSFQSLAGMRVYQGSVKVRKDNDDFWKEAGFKGPAETGINFENERNDLRFILKYIRNLRLDNYSEFYRELIAIKPGFHEMWVHGDYFESCPSKYNPRSIVFRLLRCIDDSEVNEINNLERLPSDINSKSYFTYASCNVTEGPFVFRKSPEISYYDKIRGMKCKEDLEKLQNDFYILDYYHNQIDSLDKLKELLKEAEKYRKFM
ncbi:hypothetical protein [Methanobacterium sp. ACI-7]|uniref:hypothetical protein n=1 Tax=unclassified Methanobacterium TaxID=2627676 RepID=UPI0039C1CDBD